MNKVFEKANNVLTFVRRWLDDNKIFLNVSNSPYIVFHRQQRKVASILPSLTFQGTEVKREESTKFLSITFDQFFSWKEHASNVTRRLTKFILAVCRMRTMCSKKIVLLVYNSLVYANLIYCYRVTSINADTGTKVVNN